MRPGRASARPAGPGRSVFAGGADIVRRVFGADAPRSQGERVTLTRMVVDAVVTAFHRLIERGVARDEAQRVIVAGVRARLGGAVGPDGFAGELGAAAELDWSRALPRMFGALFQASLEPGRRHALGAHFTEDADIARVLQPTLVQPWRARISRAGTADELRGLWDELVALRILDPACGSGDFLHVAYCELLALEREILGRLGVESAPRVSVRQCLGIDRDPFVVALAKLTLWLGERQACPGSALVVEDLDASFVVADALFVDWPAAQVIVGNPPFQAKNKMQAEFGAAYVRRLRARYPEVSGLADYCVYWFRRAHDALPAGGRAGLVGTNTIRQNESRAGGLAHIVASGTIVEAVAAKVWSGAAAVSVSIVSWIKQAGVEGPKRLSWQVGDRADSGWRTVELAHIGASLSAEVEAAEARGLAANAGVCFQGQTHGHAGFLLTAEEAAAALRDDPRGAEVVFPLLGGEELLGSVDGAPRRYVIDFGERDEAAARSYGALFRRVEARVLPDRRAALAGEAARNAEVSGARVNRHHAYFHLNWWRLSWRRAELLAALSRLSRYVVCARVSRRPVFEFVDAAVRPGDSLVVFALDDDYSFGVLQSGTHWAWVQARCSTLKRDCRYTSRTVFDGFVWPQAASAAQVQRVAAAGRELRGLRARLVRAHGMSRRGLGRALARGELGLLAEAQAELDRAVESAYGSEAGLAGLLAMNLRLVEAERRGEPVLGPGLVGLGLGIEVERACRSSDRLHVRL